MSLYFFEPEQGERSHFFAVDHADAQRIATERFHRIPGLIFGDTNDPHDVPAGVRAFAAHVKQSARTGAYLMRRSERFVETRRWAFYNIGAQMCSSDLGVIHRPYREFPPDTL